MTDLERRALLGDAEAQRECTENGIVLACPWCKCNERDMLGLNVYHDQYFYSCEACGCNGPVVRDNDNCDYPEHDALAAWNTRPAPPIGRCGECKHFYEDGDETSCSVNNLVFYKEHEYCSKFEPKDGEENGRTAAD